MDSLPLTLASFLIALAILISVHEWGHFWVARRLGVKVLRFSIGFGRPLWSRVGPKSGTEYVLAAIPLGGYVKMLDEREEPVAEHLLPQAFNRQPLWKRSLIVVAGPLANLIFAVIAFWWVFVTGDVGSRALVGSVSAGSVADQAGFRPGDEILAVGNRATPSMEMVVFALLAESLDGREVAVRVRDAKKTELTRWLDGETLGRLSGDANLLKQVGLTPARASLTQVPPVIGQVLRGKPAEAAGLQAGDRIDGADGKRLSSWQDVIEHVSSRPEQTIELDINRGGQSLRIAVVPRGEGGPPPVGKIGAAPLIPANLGEEYRAEVRLGPLDGLVAALDQTQDLSLVTLRVLGRLLIGRASIDNLGGPISIAESAGKSASHGVSAFIKFLAVVSISLGVLNLLPIPVLDGGHLLFFLVEAVKGSPPSEQVLMHSQRVGMAVLLTLMLLAFYVDITRWLG